MLPGHVDDVGLISAPLKASTKIFKDSEVWGRILTIAWILLIAGKSLSSLSSSIIEAFLAPSLPVVVRFSGSLGASFGVLVLPVSFGRLVFAGLGGLVLVLSAAFGDCSVSS